jgi:Family of unknown function (DUF6184)
MTTVQSLAVPLIGLVALAACKERTDHEQGTTTVTGAQMASTSQDTAISRIVAARCAREATCNNIGMDKRYTSPDVCSQKLRMDMKNDLGAKDCPNGIDHKGLEKCLAEIKAESCNNPMEMIERLAACRTSDLCIKTRAPNR